MPLARNSLSLKRPAWMKGVVTSTTFTMNRFARQSVSMRAAPRPVTNNNIPRRPLPGPGPRPEPGPLPGLPGGGP